MIFQDTNVTLGHCTDCKSSDTHWNAATRLCERNLLDVHKRKCLCINHGLIADWITLDGLDAQICNPSSPSSWFFLKLLSSVPGLMFSDKIKVLYHHVLSPLWSVVFCLYFLFSFLYFSIVWRFTTKIFYGLRGSYRGRVASSLNFGVIDVPPCYTKSHHVR